jgi:hypothetical protein
MPQVAFADFVIRWIFSPEARQRRRVVRLGHRRGDQAKQRARLHDWLKIARPS